MFHNRSKHIDTRDFTINKIALQTRKLKSSM